MHEKCSKINFFANFQKRQKKLPICKKRYAEILNVARTVVTIVEKNEKWNGRNFFGSHLEEQSVIDFEQKVEPPQRRLSLMGFDRNNV